MCIIIIFKVIIINFIRLLRPVVHSDEVKAVPGHCPRTRTRTRPRAGSSISTDLSSGPGDPGVQQQVQARPVEPAGGLHGDEDLLQLQPWPGGVGGGHGGGRWGPGASRRSRRNRRSAGARAQLEIHEEDDEDGQDQDR